MSQSASVSNEVVILVDNLTFKFLSVEDTIEVPCECMGIDEILDYNIQPSIICSYIVPTSKGVSNSGQILTGRKLVVCGQLCIDISLLPLDGEQSIHMNYYTIPFSTFLVMPEGSSAFNHYEVTCTIKDAIVEQIDERKMMVCAYLLLEA